jgi:hypothetical protein
MSNIAIQGAATGTGVFTLASPATNTNRTLTLPDEAGTVLTTAGVPASAMPAGSVIQVVSATKTDTFSTPSVSFVDITGLSVSITPTSTSSKILIIFSLPASSSSSAAWYCNLVRNSTNIVVGDAAGSRVQTTVSSYIAPTSQSFSMSFQYLDSPSATSATTYKLQLRAQSGFTAYVNRSATDTDNNVYQRTTSTITVMEIAG